VNGGRERFDLAAFLDRERRKVEERMAQAVASLEEELAPELAPVVRHGVLGGGKRIRPVLCVAAYRACAAQPDDAIYDLAVALELIHAYSLMHDDLPCMDDADLRRGQATPHKVYGEEATARAAAVLIPAASLRAFRSARVLGGESAAREVLLELTRAAGGGGMVGGQALDLAAEGASLSAEALDDLHARKTGALLAAALRIGGLAARSGEAEQRALERYGKAIGLAFQIADDVLDATASAGELGKKPSDQVLGKSTYVSVHGLDRARAIAARQARIAREALLEAGIVDPALQALADYVVERGH
jgi:geranylgeranyl pyrophosphate synthase